MSEKIWFTSDNHFGHKNILNFARDTRIGETVEEMDELMIEKWNSQVAITDRVYLLGDFSFRNSRDTANILRRLKGRLHIILGNHDYWVNPETREFFESIQDYKKLDIGKQRLELFHYPIAEFNKMHHGAWHLHGHTHGSYHHPGRGFDVGIDNRPQKDMGLWEYEELVPILESKPILLHHGKTVL